MRYYPELSDVAPLGYQAAAGMTAHSDATKLSFTTNATYYPYFTMGLIPVAIPEGVGEAPHQAVDSVLLRREARSFGGGVAFDHTFTPRSSFTLTANAHETSFSRESSVYTSWTTGGRYSYRLTKDLGLRAGYGFTRSSYPNALFSRLDEHNIDSGLDFNKALGKTRKTRIHASGGASIFELPDRRVYRATADAGLLREIGRTWAAQVNYHRGLGAGIGLNAPVFEDSLFAGVQGSLTHRLDLSVNAGYSRGQLGLYTITNPFNTYTGSARLRFAFSQIFAVYAEYVAYQYEFTNRTYLPPGVSPDLRRNGVRSGVTMWLPIYR
jgi:hypothetical protein